MMKLVNIFDLKSNAVRLPGSIPGEGTTFYKKKVNANIQ